MWEAFEHAAFYGLDNLIAIIDVNRLGQRGETMHGWDLDSTPTARRPSAGTRSRSTATTSRRSTARYGEAAAQQGQPTVIVAHTLKGKGVKEVEDKPSWHGKALDHPEEAIAELGGERNIVVEVAKPEPRASRTPSRWPAARAADVGARRGGRDAAGLRRRAGGARRVARRRRRARRRGLELDLRRDLPRRAPGPVLRDVHRRAADGRRRGRDAGAQVGAVRVDLRRVPHPRLRLHPHGRDQPGEHPPLRLARRRLDRRGRAVADGARGPRDDARRPRLDRALPVRRRTRRRSWSPRWPTATGIVYMRTTRAATPVIYGADEEFPIGGSRVLRDGRRPRDRRRRDHAARGAEGGRRSSPARASTPA